jgi:hypothetical protein
VCLNGCAFLAGFTISLDAQDRGTSTARDKAAALGAGLAANVAPQTTPLDDAKEYLNALGRRLAVEIPS